MVRHLVIAALRNMAANRLQTVIAVIGLTIGITAALLMGLIVRNQTGYDHFIPGYERTYALLFQSTIPGHPTTVSTSGPEELAALVRLNAPEVESVARLVPSQSYRGHSTDKTELRRGNVIVRQKIYWADPEVFDVLPLPVFRGDLKQALRRPDGLVLSRSDARKLLGSDEVVGQVVQVDGHPMTIRAVIADLPANGTSLESSIFVSGLASFSLIEQYKSPSPGGPRGPSTYFRLKPGVSPAEFEKRIPGINAKLWPPETGTNAAMYAAIGDRVLVPARIDNLPLFDGLHPGARTRLAVATLVGFLILFIAAINFVNLLTARAARRAVEVGLRKVCGATRQALILQFLAESIVTVFVSTCLAVALSELLLPALNVFLVTGAAFDYWRSSLLPLLLLGVIALGILAGAYPAFVLSSFHPARVMKGLLRYSPLAGMVRSSLVVLQFAILIVLVVAATVIYQQHVYSTREGLRANIDQIFVMSPRCTQAFRDQLLKLPGVAAATCSSESLISEAGGMTFIAYKGEMSLVRSVMLDWDTFALYGIKPIAGVIPPPTTAYAPKFVINEAAVKKFRFTSPEAAIGQRIPVQEYRDDKPVPNAAWPIVAIVPDFTFTSVEKNFEPVLFASLSDVSLDQTNIKLKGEQIPETLAAIDRLYRQVNHAEPISRYFLDEYLQQVYISLLRQAQLLAVFSGVAVFLAMLGLLGLSISAAERRTKEIGIRKAMGASSADVSKLLLWQFAKPVLLANLIAWPVAFYVMNNWLNGFAHHIALDPVVFVGATLLAVLVALLTVVIQSTLVARAVPATALRYE